MPKNEYNSKCGRQEVTTAPNLENFTGIQGTQKGLFAYPKIKKEVNIMIEKYNMANKLYQKSDEWKENRASLLAQSMLDYGVISSIAQRTISGGSIRTAYEWYLSTTLTEQDAKGSTGSKGKALDMGNRALYNFHRERPMHIADCACRPAGTPDIVITLADETAEKLEKSRVNVEVKSGGGCVASGATRDECLQVMAYACEAEKWLVWYFDVDSFHINAADAWHAIDRLPAIFLPVDHLLHYLEEYNGKLDTWFKFNGETLYNFQNPTSSAKKLDFLYDLYEKYSFDWPTFRDEGRLVKVKG